MKEKCGNCRYFDRTLGEVFGECRRYAPKLSAKNGEEQQPSALAIWPEVKEFNWCGDYENIGEDS